MIAIDDSSSNTSLSRECFSLVGSVGRVLSSVGRLVGLLVGKVRVNPLVVVIPLALVGVGCASPPERPAFTDRDEVGALSSGDFVGSWRYTVLNPAVPEENDTESTYTFNADGTFVGMSKPQQITMEMRSTGVWEINGNSFVVDVQNVEEISGDPLASLAVAVTKAHVRKQTGIMNPYSIGPDRIVLYSEENEVAIRLDRL